jgi:hypothetical protein
MMRLALACSLVFLCACSVSPDGRCKADSDCTAPAVCLTARSPAICVVPQGACFPTCGAGLACVSGACISSVCSPACPSSQQCDTTSVTCKDVTQPSIALTSPGEGAFAGLLLQATATARAPGGVTGVHFELRASDGSPALASAAANAPTGDPANFAAQLSLSGVPEGPAKLFALIDSAPGTLASSAVDVTVDLSPPTVAMISDGRAAFLGPANGAANVVVTAADPGAGVDPSAVQLTLLGGSNKSYPGVPEAGNQFSFSVPIADLGVAIGATGSVPFKVTATDRVGNAAALSGLPAQVVQVDLVKPTLTIATDGAVWHAAGETVNVTGLASDSQSGLTGGTTAVSLAISGAAGNLTAKGTVSAGAYSVPANLGALGFPAGFEGPLDYAVTLTDAAGNAQTATGSLSVDDAPPRISAITQPAGEATANGRAFFRATGSALPIGATIADGGSGVDPSSVVLQIVGGAPGALTAVAGTRSAGDGWSFALPRSVGRGLDGSSPVQFFVTAKDKLGHAASSGVQSIFFDDAAPVVTSVSDPAWYARTAAGGHVVVTVHETIADIGAGLASASLTVANANSGGALTTTPGTCTPLGDCTFALDAAFLAAGSEGRLQFTITAQDKLSQAAGDAHQTTVSDFRQVDGKPPSVTITRIANAALPATGTSGVTYPTAIANTGYDGSHFVYSDTLTISGTIQDSGAGIDTAAAPPVLEVDGQPVESAKGPKIAISGCTDGTTQVCSFVVTVKLNDLAQAGAFHAADSTMQIVVGAADKAVDGTKGAAGNAGTSSSPSFAVTRFWWRQNLPGSTAIGGLAITPAGVVVATTTAAAGADTVFALNHEGPLNPGGATLWHKGANFYGAGSDLGEIDAPPALGTGPNPNVYVPTLAGDVVAFDLAGATVWNCGLANLVDPVRHASTVLPGTRVGSVTNCEAVVSGSDGAIWSVCGTAPNACTERSSPLVAPASSPTIRVSGDLFVGSGSGVSQVSLTASGGVSPVIAFTTTDPSVVTNVVTDGSSVFAVNNVAQKAYGLDKTLTRRFSKSLTSAVAGAPVVLPTTASIRGLLVSENSKAPSDSLFVLDTDPANPTETGVASFAKLPSSGSSPLLGSDNRIYADGGGAVTAIDQEVAAPFSVEWSFGITTTPSFSAPPTMACDGTLYAAAGATVYAFVTDARGLANTPWPKYQRDTRNSGNADAATLWGANVNGVCVQ